jgi:hypothetical protein
MSYQIDFRVLLTCVDDDAAEVETGLLVDYCEERLNETSPARLMQALGEVLMELHESDLINAGETVH